MRNFGDNRLLRVGPALFAASLAGWALPAGAQIVETSELENYIEYDTTGAYGPGTESGSIYEGAGDFGKTIISRSSTQVAALSFDVTSRLDQSTGNFSFLHNAYCVGSCYLSIDTVLTFSLFNSGSATEAVRFQSQITPGHLARQNFGGGPVEGNFNFTLVDGDFVRPFALQLTGESANNTGVYGTSDPTYTTTHGNPVALNGLVRQTSGGAEVFNGGAAPNWHALDWSATNIGVDLRPLLAGETRKFTFVLSTFIRMENPCSQFEDCAGLQVAFGDPRNDGSVQNLGILAFTGANANLANANYSPVVGAQFDPFNIRYGFVPQATPDMRTTPDVIVPRYDGIFVAPLGGVPEPSSWVMLIVGFGAVGAAARGKSRARTALSS